MAIVSFAFTNGLILSNYSGLLPACDAFLFLLITILLVFRFHWMLFWLPCSEAASLSVFGFVDHNLNGFIVLIWTQVMERAQSNPLQILPKKHHSFNSPGEKRVGQLLPLDKSSSNQPMRPPSYPAASYSREMELAEPQLRIVSGPNVPRRVSYEPNPSQQARMVQQHLEQESRDRNPRHSSKEADIERDLSVSKVCLC